MKWDGSFKESVLNNLNFGHGVSNSAQKLTSMVIEKKQKLLSHFLTLLPHTEGFVHHRDQYHDFNGFLADGSGIQEQYLVKRRFEDSCALFSLS